MKKKMTFYLILSMIFCVPVILLAQFGKDKVLISWEANKESDLAGYNIYYGKNTKQYEYVLNVGNITNYEIDNLNVDQRYYFVVTALDFAGNESNYSNEVNIILRTAIDDSTDGDNDNDTDTNQNEKGNDLNPLVYNYPNPFNPNYENTKIRYELNNPGDITIKIFDVNSNLVKTILKNRTKREGEHTEDVWDGTNKNGDYVSNGVYFCTVQTQKEQHVIKIAIKK